MTFRDAVTERACAVCHRLSVRAAVLASQWCAVTQPLARWRSLGAARQRSEAQWHSGTRRPAAVRHAARCPHRQHVAGGCRVETEGRALPVAVSVVKPKRDGSTWGAKPSAPKPQARASGSRQAQHCPKAQPRPAGEVETLARAWSTPLAGHGRCGGAGIQRACPGVQTGQTPGPASSRWKGGGELQPRSGCSLPLFGPRRTRG
jgi:hypothetical protein